VCAVGSDGTIHEQSKHSMSLRLKIVEGIGHIYHGNYPSAAIYALRMSGCATV
jgi:hypothetical protein